MYFGLFLGAALLTCPAGGSSVHGPPQTVLAFAGGDAILPCSFSITDSGYFPTVEWSKEGLRPDVVFLYRDDRETYEMKNPAFEYRTSFITKEMKNGNISLRISNVQLSDGGRYRCMRIWKNKTRDMTTVELVVGAVSEPKLSVVSADSGGLTLQCEATCWLLEPDIKFLDHQGNTIPADDPKRHENGSRCYTVTRRATLQDHTSRVTCRAQQPGINQTRDAVIFIAAEYLSSSSGSVVFLVVAAFLLLSAICGSAVFLWMRFCKSAKGENLPDPRSMNDTCDYHLLSVRVDGADNETNRTIERLTREVTHLKTKLNEKEETICRLLSTNRAQLSPICQFGPSTVYSPAASTNSIHPQSDELLKSQGQNPAILRQKSSAAPLRGVQRQRIHSSPAALDLTVLSSSSSASTSKKKRDGVSRSISECSSLIRPKVPRLQRPHSFVPTSPSIHLPLLRESTEESD